MNAWEYTEDQMNKMVTIVNAMIERSAKDEAFRNLCQRDVAAAFKELTGVDLPEGAGFKFAEPGSGDISKGIFELPSPVGELSDEDLESVAGGVSLPLLTPDMINPVVVAYGAPGYWDGIDFPRR